MSATLPFATLIKTLTGFFQGAYDALLDVFNIFTLPITQLTEDYGELWPFLIEDVIRVIVQFIENMTGFHDISLIGIMLGVGLPIYLMYQFATWVLNVVT